MHKVTILSILSLIFLCPAISAATQKQETTYSLENKENTDLHDICYKAPNISTDDFLDQAEILIRWAPIQTKFKNADGLTPRDVLILQSKIHNLAPDLIFHFDRIVESIQKKRDLSRSAN